MLEIKNLNKYFNRHRKNQIYVINNTSIVLRDNGLVALLGNSGSGKTTLLNTIGGLDKASSGSIYINGKKITSRFSYKVDKIRNLNIGYIFQDYKLIDDWSVYENVSIVLKMMGIKDKKEIDTRVLYVLDKVGMLRYKKRPASMLSGGEKQRVGIARAIVKNPDIILADEPTGNLDSRNSLEVMNIIKAISRDRQVILVTHERELAKFYADRIIEIKDGTITNDYKNEHNDTLDYEVDNRFYLKDLEHLTEKNDNYEINIYRNSPQKLKLDIVVDANNIYIRSNDNMRIEEVDDNSSIEFINDHYKNIKKEEVDKYDFAFENIINKDIPLKYSSILNPITLIINGFKKVLDYSFLKKILLVGFFLAGMFIMYSVSSIKATLTVEDIDFVTTNKDYLEVASNKVKLDDYLNYEKMDKVNYLIPGNSIVKFKVNYGGYYQTSTATDILSGSLSDVETIKDKKLLYGRWPENEYEIVVDKFAINNMFKNDIAKMVGILRVKDMLNKDISIDNMNNFKIVGIIDNGSPSVYTNSSMFIDIIHNSSETKDKVMNYELFKDKIDLKKGRIPTNDYEVVVPLSDQDNMPLNKEINVKVNEVKLKVVGYYDSKYNYDYYFTNLNTIKYNTITNSKGFSINTNDKAFTLKKFRDLNLNISDSYDKDLKTYKDNRKSYVKSSLLVSGVILVISLVEIFLMIRSSFLSRVKEIGIYRAIGIKKSDIYKMFSGEIIAITTLASVPGILLMAYILKVLSGIKFLKSYFIINNELILLSVVSIYIFNLFIGLFPIFNTLRKTPASILARHDVD